MWYAPQVLLEMYHILPNCLKLPLLFMTSCVGQHFRVSEQRVIPSNFFKACNKECCARLLHLTFYFASRHGLVVSKKRWMEMCQLDQRGRQSHETAWKSEIDWLFTTFGHHCVVFRLCWNCLCHMINFKNIRSACIT